MTKTLEDKVKSALQELDPEIRGSITFRKPSATKKRAGADKMQGAVLEAHGHLSTSLSYDDVYSVLNDVTEARVQGGEIQLTKPGLEVSIREDKKTSTSGKIKRSLDEVSVVDFKWLPPNALTPSGRFKIQQEETYDKVKEAWAVTQFIPPLIVDQSYRVIDGDLRLRFAQDGGISTVPVIIVDADEERSAFLRLTLNRLNEFNRWDFDQVDHFMDEEPWLAYKRPLESFGFFGTRILPETFFSNTILEYKIEEDNEQQGKYQQNVNLADWAREQFARQEAARTAKSNDAKKIVKTAKQAADAGAASLFDALGDVDEVPTHDVPSTVHNSEEEKKEVAGRVTEAYDAVRRPELEAQGRWITNKRSTAEKTADRKAEREAAELRARIEEEVRAEMEAEREAKINAKLDQAHEEAAGE